MKSIVRLGLVLCVTCLTVSAAPASAAAGRQDLVAHGSSDRFWLARVFSPEPGEGASGTVRTLVYVRSVGESRWLPVTQRQAIEARVVAMAHRGTQLALLLDDGDWLLVSEDALVTGRPLPPGGAILDIASGGDTLLALARFQIPSSPVARPPATSSAGAPGVSHRLALFSLSSGGWVEVGDLGAAAAPARADVSLAVVDLSVVVALRDAAPSSRVRLLRQTQDHGWADAGTVDVGSNVAAIKLLGGGPVPVLWVLAPDGGYSLHWFGPQGVRSEAFAPPVGVKPTEVAAAIAIERVRVLFTAEGKLFERTCDPLPSPLPTGAATAPATAPASRPAAKDTRILLPRPISPWLTWWVQPLLTVALLFTVVASLRRHRQMQEAMAGAQKLPLAPPGRRLAAGIIDAAPLFVAAGIVWLRDTQLDDPAALLDDWTVRIAAVSGIALYFIHTTATEVLLGRTIGKWICGLRVVGLNGERPGPGPLLVRNLLRVIDVLILFFPLVLVLYSPLRQRAGDVAAGTLVVLDLRGGEAEPVEEEKKAAQPAEVDVTG